MEMCENALKLRYLLRKNGITQNVLSDEMGFSLGHINRILNKRDPSTVRFKRLFEIVIKERHPEDEEEILSLFSLMCDAKDKEV